MCGFDTCSQKTQPDPKSPRSQLKRVPEDFIIFRSASLSNFVPRYQLRQQLIIADALSPYIHRFREVPRCQTVASIRITELRWWRNKGGKPSHCCDRHTLCSVGTASEIKALCFCCLRNELCLTVRSLVLYQQNSQILGFSNQAAYIHLNIPSTHTKLKPESSHWHYLLCHQEVPFLEFINRIQLALLSCPVFFFVFFLQAGCLYNLAAF